MDVMGLTKAFAGEAEDGSAINEAVDGGYGVGLGWKGTRPVRKAGVGSDHDGAVPVSCRRDRKLFLSWLEYKSNGFLRNAW